MEMTTDQVPEVQEEKEDAGWLTIEQKGKIIEELVAFEAGGGTIEDFAMSKGISKWTLMRYKKQVKKSGIIEVPRKNGKSGKEEQYRQAKALITEGTPVINACDQVGITMATYYYYKKVREARKAERAIRKAAPREVKIMDGRESKVLAKHFNAPLIARIASLEKLVVELSLDKQALIEAREGAI